MLKIKLKIVLDESSKCIKKDYSISPTIYNTNTIILGYYLTSTMETLGDGSLGIDFSIVNNGLLEPVDEYSLSVSVSLSE